MNINHTPGPWTIDGRGQIITQERIGPCSHEIIACMPVWFASAKAGAHATQDHILANARLIAAAPELLNALSVAEATIIRLERHAPGSANGTLDVIRAAVAKACTV